MMRVRMVLCDYDAAPDGTGEFVLVDKEFETELEAIELRWNRYRHAYGYIEEVETKRYLRSFQ
jgi:hypothetical protein